MRAAVVTGFDPARHSGGIETFTRRLVELLERRGVACDLVLPGGRQRPPGLRHGMLADLVALGAALRGGGRGYSLVVCNGFYGLGLFPPTVRTVNVFHASHRAFAEAVRPVVPRWQYEEYRCLWGGLGEAASGFGRALVAVSPRVRDELAREHALKDVTVVAHGVDAARFRPIDRADARRSLGLRADAEVGLFVGRWDVLKGCDLAAAAMDRAPEVEWLLALGDAGADRARPIPGRARVLENVPHDAMPALYSAADFVLFPSRYEGFGYALVEALACGVPVLATPVGVAPDLLSGDALGPLLLPDPAAGSRAIADAVAGTLGRLRRDAGWRARIAAEGRARVKARHDLARWEPEMARALGVA